MNRDTPRIVFAVGLNFVRTFQETLRKHAAARTIPIHRHDLIEELRRSVESDDFARWNDANHSIDVIPGCTTAHAYSGDALPEGLT